MKRNQKGFGGVEGLLVIIIVLLVGFIGYYVYHTKNNTNATLNSAAKTSNSEASGTTQSTASSKKLVFKELGLQMDLPTDLTEMSYNVQHLSDGDAYYLTDPSFKSANEKCYGQKIDDAGPSFAAMGKLSGQFDPNQSGESGLLKQFSDYYISISYPNGITSCDQTGVDEQYIFTIAHQLQDSFVTAFKNTVTAVQ